MSWALDPIQIEDGKIGIRAFGRVEIPEIALALHDPHGWFGVHWGYDSPAKIEAYLESQLGLRHNGVGNPLVYRAGEAVAGITRLMRIDPANRSLEIGGTWVAPRWRRSFVNTRVKYQLLAYCFEQLRAERIELRVDARNTASQRAVLRLGATFEGRLRNRQIFPDGTTRDGFMFSFTRPEWPQVEERLRRLLNGEPSPAREPYFPRAFGSRRLELRCFEAADAGAVFTLIDKNRPVLAGVFPRTERALREKSAADGYVVERLTQWNARSAFCYGVFLRETGSLIGQLQFKSIDWSARGCEMGYFLDEKYHRQGIGSEMGTAAIGMAFGEMKFRRLALRILPSNAASLALARTLGFEPEGCHRKEFSGLNGELQDILYYSRVQG